MLGAPNSGSIPTTQICFPPYYLQNIILFTKDLVFVVSIAIQRFWRYGSLYLDLSWYHFFFLGFNEFHVSDKKPITDLCKSAPTFIRFLVHPIQPNFTLYPLSLYDSCWTCLYGWVLYLGGLLFLYPKKKKGEEALNLASFAFLDKDWIG